jgi:hypothetical protein
LEGRLLFSPLLASINSMLRQWSTARELKGHLADFVRELVSCLQRGFKYVLRAVFEVGVLCQESLHLSAEGQSQGGGFASPQSAGWHRSKPQAADFRRVIQSIANDISLVLAEHTKHRVPVNRNRDPEPRTQVIVGDVFAAEQCYSPVGERRHVEQTLKKASNDLTTVLEKVLPHLIEKGLGVYCQQHPI